MGRHFTAVVLGVVVAAFSSGAVDAQGEGLDACDDLPDWSAPQTTTNGDTNGNQTLELTDAVFLLGFLFQGGPPPAQLGCGESPETAVLSWWQNGDANGDWKLDLSDAILLLGHLFLGGDPPIEACHAPSPVFPPESRPYGLSYGEWSAIWWRWQLCIPLSLPADPRPIHPALDGPCNVAQSQPPFLLGGAFTTDPVERICAVPRDRPILFALITAECSTVEEGDFGCVDEPTCLECAARTICPQDELRCTIDGEDVQDLHSFRAVSPFFHFKFPEEDIFGVPELEGFSAADGYYLLLPPQARGEHTIEWFARLACLNFEQDITYTLIVE